MTVPPQIGHGRSKVGVEWTDELVDYALNRFHRLHLRTPTLAELRNGIDEMPSYATIRRRYGNAAKMFRRHGYRVRSRGGQVGRLFVPARDTRGRFLSERR
jgi:hypothetical protein